MVQLQKTVYLWYDNDCIDNGENEMVNNIYTHNSASLSVSYRNVPSRDNGWTECLNNDQRRIIYAESRNRKLLEQLEEQKKRLRGVHTAGGAGTAAPSTSSVASSSRWAALSTCRYTVYTKHTLPICTLDGCMLGCALTVTHAHACMDTHTHTHACTHTFMDILANTHTRTHTYICRHICTHTHTHASTHTCIHARAHTHTLTHTELLLSGGGGGGCFIIFCYEVMIKSHVE